MLVSLYLKLFIQFFYIGLLSFGGGYSTLPFLYSISENFHWYSINQLTNMIALASVTPGPVGINMATYTGFTTCGVIGSVLATLAVVLPSLVIVTFVSKCIDKFNSNLYVKNVIRTLKPAGCALLTAVGVKLLFTSNLNLIGTLILVVFITGACIKKKDPLFYLSLGAMCGIFAGYLNLIGV